ncbi:hypothetical protein FB451DRAFT_1193608 [Mycena latifolia]|nr:hypothetical protein FB451DRAFT_1193608 [Mycena latifolia]
MWPTLRPSWWQDRASATSTCRSACPPASPVRAKNALLGGALLAFVAGVSAYALAAVKQDTFASSTPRGDERRGRAQGDADGGEACNCRRWSACDRGDGGGCDEGCGGTKATGPLRALGAQSELDTWKLDGFKVLWGLLALDLQASAFVSLVGFLGVLRNIASHVRLYRDCFPADLAFTAFLTVLGAYAAWPLGRLACSELALLSPDETCERAAVALLAGMPVLTVLRLHFTPSSLSPRTTFTSSPPLGAPTAGSATVAAPAEHTRGGRGVCPVRALERSAEVWVRAPPRRMRGCSTRVVHSKREWI